MALFNHSLTTSDSTPGFVSFEIRNEDQIATTVGALALCSSPRKLVDDHVQGQSAISMIQFELAAALRALSPTPDLTACLVENLFVFLQPDLPRRFFASRDYPP